MTDETLVETTDQPLVEGEQSQQAENSDNEAGSHNAPQPVTQPTNQTPEWVQRRFSEMTRARHDAERKAEAATAEADTYRRLLDATQHAADPNAPPIQQPAVKAPVNDEERIRQAAQQMYQTEQFNSRCNAVFETGKKEIPGFEDAVKNLGLMGVSQDFIAGVVGLDDAHKVLAALGSNPDETMRILSLSPLQQGRELERLASKAPAKAVKPVSNAPEPIGSTIDNGASSGKPVEQMSIDEFMASRNTRKR